MTFSVRDRAWTALVLVAAALELAVLASTGSARANARTEERDRVAGLTLCYFYDGKLSRECEVHPAVNSPASAVHLLRATWKWRFGDTVKVFERQTVPVVHARRMLRTCSGTPPCYASAPVPPPRYGGIVAADYVAVLFRGGKRAGESNIVQLDWVT